MSVVLTKKVRELLLALNEGFEARTDYSAKNITETVFYKITNGELRIRMAGKSAFSGRYDNTVVGSDDQVRRFLRTHLGQLKTDGLE